MFVVVGHDENLDIGSELFMPYVTETSDTAQDGGPFFKYFMADVEAFLKPVAVVPDIGGRNNVYFVLKDCQVWRDEFMEWLEEDNSEEEFEETDSEDDE